jgi:hypothetical protein
MKLEDIPVAGTAYDVPWGDTIILRLAHKILLFGDTLDTSLLPPQQICANGLIGEPMAKQFTQGSQLLTWFI